MKAIVYLPYLIFLLIISCQQSQEPSITAFTGVEMTIPYKILIGKNLNQVEEETVKEIIKNTFAEINDIHNKWNPESEVAQLNRLSANQTIPISEELAVLLSIADYLYNITGGHFDPTIEPLQQLWKQALSEGRKPTSQEVSAIKDSLGWNKIHFENGLFWKENDATSIDLSGIAKGLLVDHIVEKLQQANFDSIYVEWGGEIKTQGQHPHQRPWSIFISHLGNTNPLQAIAVVPLQNEAIATSGDYEQYWEILNENGEVKRYFHIINPHTLEPLEASDKSIASASIVAPSCTIADGLATATLFFEDKESASNWLKKSSMNIKGLRYWLLDRSALSN
ncbi:MAG: FAD:protein FMN transferase [Parachlamydiaceae bacterium]